MSRSFPFRSLLIALLLVAVVAAVTAVRLAATDRTVPPGAKVVSIEAATQGRPIPSGFVGLSFEYPALLPYTGWNPYVVNPVLEELIRELAPGQSPVLRIGGDSTDATWWPASSLSRPAGVRFSLNRRWGRVAAALARAIDAKMILGIDLEADSGALVATEGRKLVASIGRAHIGTLELGNEPELYGTFTYFHAPDGRKVPGRPRDYNFTAFTSDFSRMAAVLPKVSLAGPTIGAPGWMRHLRQFLDTERSVGTVTLHRYPLQRCYVPQGSPQYPTIPHLFSDSSSRGLANSVEHYAALSHAHGHPLRIDEMNSVSCGGAPGVSDVFASALWSIDAMFEMARVGVDGVNIHTFPGATYQLFTFKRVRRRWQAFVEPEYYGLMMFARAAPAGSRLLRTSGASGPLKIWATRGPDGRTRVMLINEATSGTRLLAVRAPAPGSTASLERLQAPSVYAHRGVTLGGQSFGSQTATGLLAGAQHVESIAPIGRDYVVRLAPGTAAMLTFTTS